MGEYQSRKAQFMQGIQNQKKLSDSQALEIGVKPFIEGQWGDSYYVVSVSPSRILRASFFSSWKLYILEI